MTIWRMCMTCWIPKATNTHSEYVILTAFPLEQWLDERASMLRCTYITCLYNTVCPTRYRTRHFFNNFTVSQQLGALDTHYRHIPLHFSHNERTPVQISLQYLHWCYSY